jgi:hypothetical protein
MTFPMGERDRDSATYKERLWVPKSSKRTGVRVSGCKGPQGCEAEAAATGPQTVNVHSGGFGNGI